MRAAHTKRIARRGWRTQPLVLNESYVGLLDQSGSRLALFDKALESIGEIEFGDAGPVERVVMGEGPSGVLGVWVHAHRTQRSLLEGSCPIAAFFALPDDSENATALIRVRLERHASAASAAGELIVRDDKLFIVGDAGLWGSGGGIACCAAVCLERPRVAGDFEVRSSWSLVEVTPTGRDRDELYSKNFIFAWLADGGGALHAITSTAEAWSIDSRTGSRLSAQALPGLEAHGPWALEQPQIVRSLPTRAGGLLLEVSCVDDEERSLGHAFLYDERMHLVSRASSVFPVAIDPEGRRALTRGGRWAIRTLPELNDEIEGLDDVDLYDVVACDPEMTWAVGVRSHADESITLSSFIGWLVLE